MSVVRKAQRVAWMHRRLAGLVAEGERLKKELHDTGQELIEEMAEEGTPSLKIDLNSVPKADRLIDVCLTEDDFNRIWGAVVNTIDGDAQQRTDAQLLAQRLNNAITDAGHDAVGVRTITPKSRTWCYPQVQQANPDREENLRLLAELDPTLVKSTVNVNTLSSLCKEQYYNNETGELVLPDELMPAIKTEVKTGVAVTKS